jgi:hypothetical protein
MDNSLRRHVFQSSKKEHFAIVSFPSLEVTKNLGDKEEVRHWIQMIMITGYKQWGNSEFIYRIFSLSR